MLLIDIVIPVLNEERYLKKCLESILQFTIPKEINTHIYIVDGGSTDKTIQIAKKYKELKDNISILGNEKKIQSTALNLIIETGKGSYLLRLDAHSRYPKNYLESCFRASVNTNADNVGGMAITEPGSSKYSALLVQALTTHWFGVGDSGFRIGAKEGKRDTVPFGFFNKEIFYKVGMFNEKLVRAQDYEFNNRINRAGGLVWFDPDITFKYSNQASLIRFYKKQLTLEAPYNAYMWWLSPSTFNIRHSITGFFTLGFLFGLALSPFFINIKLSFLLVISLYILISTYASFQQSIRYKKIFHFFSLPFCFFLFHFLHGLGILMGIFNLLFNRSPVQSKY